MKKTIITLTTIALLLMSLVAVSASDIGETEATTGTNMDAASYLELRTQQLDDALAAGTIDQEQYDLLLTHINENAVEGEFGRGPNGYMTRDSHDCALGEDGALGIFRNENSGTRNGQGNGNKGAGNGTGNGSSNRTSKGSGNGGQGQRLQDGSANNEECILD